MLWGLGLWGLGHVYLRRMARGMALLLTSSIFMLRPLLLVEMGYPEPTQEMDIVLQVLVPMVIGVAIGILQAYDAYRLANEYNRYAQQHGRPPW